MNYPFKSQSANAVRRQQMTRRNSTRLPFPSPSEMWGDYKVESWTRQENGLFAVNLQILASAIVYTNKEITDRINTRVREIIAASKDGLMKAQEAIDILSPQKIFSKDEWEEVKENAEKQGKMMSAFFMNDNSVN